MWYRIIWEFESEDSDEGIKSFFEDVIKDPSICGPPQLLEKVDEDRNGWVRVTENMAGYKTDA